MFEKEGRRVLAKRKTLCTIDTKKSGEMEGTLERHSLLQFGQLSNPAESSSSELRNELGSVDGGGGDCGEKSFILSQDFFW